MQEASRGNLRIVRAVRVRWTFQAPRSPAALAPAVTFSRRRLPILLSPLLIPGLLALLTCALVVHCWRPSRGSAWLLIASVLICETALGAAIHAAQGPLEMPASPAVPRPALLPAWYRPLWEALLAADPWIKAFGAPWTVLLGLLVLAGAVADLRRRRTRPPDRPRPTAHTILIVATALAGTALAAIAVRVAAEAVRSDPIGPFELRERWPAAEPKENAAR